MSREFTPSQYESLLKLARLGRWIINGIKTEDARDPRYDDAMNALYASAHENDCERFVRYDSAEKKFYATHELDEEIEKLREEYDDEIFWDELIEKLALRDMMGTQNEKHWYGGDTNNISHMRSDSIKKYVEEFEQNGVENLFIKGVE